MVEKDAQAGACRKLEGGIGGRTHRSAPTVSRRWDGFHLDGRGAPVCAPGQDRDTFCGRHPHPPPLGAPSPLKGEGRCDDELYAGAGKK